ncbi:hypothetical protein RDI58_030116 [Solanum bulbocastanum]|uniref:Uncharacterized protein n=2 Tax=Solanum bulbocastanum TaxID=147425 RepID=A0AAN8SMW6_SOLBU
MTRSWTLGWAGRSALGVHRSSRPFCRRCAPGLNWPGRASGAVTLKKLECSKQAYALYTLAWDNIIGFRRTSWASCGLSGRAAWALDGMHGLSVLRRWATTKTCRRRLVGRPCAAEGIYLDRPIRVWCGNGSAFGRVASSRAPVTANSRRGTSGARKAMYGQTLSVGRSWAVPVQELQSASNTFAASASGHGMSCRASGRVPGVHRRSYSRTAHEWYWACAVRLDPCFEQRRPNPHAVSVADQAQSRLVGRRYPVLHTQCAGITRVQSVGFRPSRSTRGANPEAALAPRAFLAPSCEGAVRERRLEFSDSRARGLHRLLSALERMLLADDGRARLGPVRALSGADGGHAARGVAEECYLVDPASSHMLVSKIKPCMCKYEQIQTVKLRMAH